MSEKVTSLLFRQLDHLHRVLRTVAGSQSTIGPVYGDSDNLPDVYYVDSGNGSNVNDGRDPAFPLAAIDAAINRCTASQGDVILVQPGHTETLTTVITLDVAGVSIIGIGEGALRPQITVNGDIDGITITAANCTVENILFNEATAATADSAINVAAADARIAYCRFDLGANDDEGSITVTGDGERLTVEDCEVFVTADGPDEWILFEGVVDRPIIRRCTVVCSDGTNAFDDSAINFGDTDQAVTNPVVVDNVFIGGGVAATAIGGTSALVAPTIERNVYAGSATGPAGLDGQFVEGLGYRVEKTNGTPVGTDPLFTVTGQVLVKLLYGEVTTVISGGTAPELLLRTTAGDIAVAGSTVITDDAAGTMYLVVGDTGETFNGGDAPSIEIAQTGNADSLAPFILDGSGIESVGGGTAAATGGVIRWTMYYIPLESGARVVAAA